MAIRGSGALGVWHDVVGAHQREVETWYNREHHAERVAVPGFLRARRYINRGTGLRYFSRYDVTSADVLASAPYLRALNEPSPWSRQIFPHYRRTVRGAFEVVARRGIGEGGFATALRFEGREAEAAGRDLDGVLDQLAGAHGVVGVELWRIDVAATTPPTTERDLRTPGEGFPAWALLLDTSSPEHGPAALAEMMPREVRDRANVEVFGLVFQMIAPAA